MLKIQTCSNCEIYTLLCVERNALNALVQEVANFEVCAPEAVDDELAFKAKIHVSGKLGVGAYPSDMLSRVIAGMNLPP